MTQQIGADTHPESARRELSSNTACSNIVSLRPRQCRLLRCARGQSSHSGSRHDQYKLRHHIEPWMKLATADAPWRASGAAQAPRLADTDETEVATWAREESAHDSAHASCGHRALCLIDAGAYIRTRQQPTLDAVRTHPCRLVVLSTSAGVTDAPIWRRGSTPLQAVQTGLSPATTNWQCSHLVHRCRAKYGCSPSWLHGQR